jgi:tight adherence protein C
VTAALLAGAGIGGGLWLIVVGLWPARPTVAAALADLDHASRGPSITAVPAGGLPGARVALGREMARVWSTRAWATPALRADLAVTGSTLDGFLARKALWGIAGLLAPAAAAALLSVAGVSVPLLVPVWVSLAAAAVGFFTPDTKLRSTATTARVAFRVAVGAYLDLVAMRMASGAGLAQALSDAAAVGTGPAFAQLRGALADARTDGLSPAASLGRLGEELHLPDLVDTATRLALVDSTGAHAQTSLRAQAASLRDRELTDAAGQAGERSQSMLIAQVVLGLGFVLFLGYPAVAKVLAT